MNATILPNGNLRVDVDTEERGGLQRLSENELCSNDTLYDVFESLIANSEYDWVSPKYIGALSDAPILGIYGESVPGNPKTDGGRLAGRWEVNGALTVHVDPVVEAWWYPNYMLRSPQEDLAEQGFCIFEKGE